MAPDDSDRLFGQSGGGGGRGRLRNERPFGDGLKCDVGVARAVPDDALNLARRFGYGSLVDGGHFGRV